jgi:hypothetical protein
MADIPIELRGIDSGFEGENAFAELVECNIASRGVGVIPAM